MREIPHSPVALYEVAHPFGTLIAETILASVHVRARKKAGHTGASDLIKALQTPCEEGAVHIRGIRIRIDAICSAFCIARTALSSLSEVIQEPFPWIRLFIEQAAGGGKAANPVRKSMLPRLTQRSLLPDARKQGIGWAIIRLWFRRCRSTLISRALAQTALRTE